MTEIIVLGAPDPEMALCEKLAIAAGKTVVYATSGGKRVTSANAYRADISVPIKGAQTIVLVECYIPALGQRHVEGVFGLGAPLSAEEEWLAESDIVRIDHHSPGDPGYGKPPEKFLPASSVGQLLTYLAVGGSATPPTPENWGYAFEKVGIIQYLQQQYGDTVMTPGWCIQTNDGLALVDPEIVLAAAADHCLAHAYAGRCPGVDPDTLMRWSRAMKITVEQLLQVHTEMLDAIFAAHYSHMLVYGNHEGPGLLCKNEDCIRRLQAAEMLHAAAFAVDDSEKLCSSCEERHISGCICADCSGAELTAEND